MPKINGSYFGTTSQPIFQQYQTAGMLQPAPPPAAAPPADTAPPPTIGVTPPPQTTDTPVGAAPIFDLNTPSIGGLQPQQRGMDRLANAMMRAGIQFTEQ